MEVIEELIKLAKEMDAATKRGEDLGLTDDEVPLTPSFPLGRAAPIASRCRFASFHSPCGQPAAGYLRCAPVQSPCSFGSPDLQEDAVKTVLQQAELLCAEWA